MPVGRSQFAVDAAELGEWMVRLRDRRSLRAVVIQLEKTPHPLSKSTLHRYETGQTLPPIQYAEVLDDVYLAKGWLMLSIRRLWRAKWDPWAVDWPERYHSGSWPAEFSGVVWMKVLSADHNSSVKVAIDLEWGPWGQIIHCTVPPQGVVLLTGKARDLDGVSRTLNLFSDQAVFILFGAGSGDLDSEVVVDIRRGWEFRNPGAENSEHQHGPAHE